MKRAHRIKSSSPLPLSQFLSQSHIMHMGTNVFIFTDPSFLRRFFFHSPSPPLFLCLSLSQSLSISASICLSWCSLSLSVSPSPSLSLSLYVYLCLSLCLYMSLCLSVSVFLSLFPSLSRAIISPSIMIITRLDMWPSTFWSQFNGGFNMMADETIMNDSNRISSIFLDWFRGRWISFSFLLHLPLAQIENIQTKHPPELCQRLKGTDNRFCVLLIMIIWSHKPISEMSSYIL